MPELPSTAIGLIATVIAGAGGLIWKLNKGNADSMKVMVDTFMKYIETKNHNLERTTTLFVEASEKKNKQFEIMLADHDKRHQGMIDDMAARLEASIPLNK